MADEEIAGLAVKIAMDDSSFTTGIQGLRRELNVLDSGFKVIQSSSTTFGKSLDGLKEKASSLGEKIEVQQKIVQQYQEQLTKSKTVLEENSKTMIDLKEKVDAAKTAWQESAVAEGENAETTKKLEAEYKSLNKEYQSQEQLVAKNSKSVDGYTIQTNKQQAALNSMRNELNATNKEIETQSSKWISAGNQLTTLSKKTKDVGEGFTKAGESMSTKVTLPVVAGLAAMTVSASTFEHQMADISKEVASKGEDVKSVMGQMSSSSLKWSEDFGQSTDKINEGLLVLVKDGYTGSEAMNIMGTSLDTARGADEDLATVVDQLGSSLEAYGMKTNDAATTTANMTHMADVFAYTANHSKASISSLGEAFSIVGPLASQLKIPMQQIAAAIGELQSNGIDASTAATALQAGLVNLTKPTKKMQTELDLMKFSAFDSTGKMKDLTTIIEEMSKKTSGWTDKQREAAYATIFGKESLATWGILMHKGSDYLGELSSNANNATGEVKKLSDSMKNTPQNNLKELGESVKALGIAFGEDVLPTLIPVVKQTTEMVKGFANLDDGTKKMIITVAGVAAVVGPTLVVIGKVATGISAIEGLTGKVTGAIGKKVAANATDTASTVVNTAATNINTAAQEANAKARGETAASEGISTAAKDVSTAAEAENTAATVANDAAQVKGSKGILGAAKNFIGLGTAAGTAGEAVAGAGTAATGAGEAATGMGTAAAGAGVSLGIVAVAAAGVSLAGYGIYKAYKMVTDQTVPQIDLFGDSVVETATKVKAQNGTVATQMKDTTVSISNSTKQAISSYMDMDKKVSKSMQDIYLNSNNFSKQEKSTVISAYTDMANKVTSLTGSNKNAVLNNFKQMVSNTTTLTKQSRADIVKEYSTMVNQVSGLTAQQKQKTIKDFSDSLVQASGITQSQATGIINQFTQMGNKINSAINSTDQKQIKSVQDLFSKTTTITNQEQSDILNKMQHSDASKKAEADIYVKQVTDIYNKAASEHRNLTQTEENTVNDIRTRMQDLAVQKMSANETEQKVIMQRLKDYNGQMTLAQASDTIQNAEKQRKGAVDAADKQYNEELATIYQMRDDTHTITADQADKMIAEAKRQHKQSVDEADGQKKEIVSKVKQMNANVEKELDTSTGNQYNTYQKWGKQISDFFSDIGKRWDNFWSKVGGTHTIDIKTVTSGATASVDGAAGTLSNLHGLRFNATGGVFSKATQVTLGGNPNNIVGEGQYSEAVIPLSNTVLAGIGQGIVKATTELKNNKLSIEFADNSGQATQFGQKTMESIVTGMQSKTKLLSSISSEITDNLTQAGQDINSIFSTQLTTNVDVLNNKAIAVSGILANMVQPERKIRSDMWDAMAKGTETYDTALNKLQADNDKLGVSTGDSQKDLRNMLGEMTNLSTISVIASNEYTKLGNSIGWTDSKTEEALKTYQDAQKSYLEMGQKVVEQQQKIASDVTTNINNIYDKLKDSLKDYYTDMQKQDEDYWNNQITANNTWKENTLNNLQTVYNAKKQALDDESTQEDIQNSDEDDAAKRAELNRQLAMHLGADKRKELQQELDDLNKTEDRRHEKEKLDAQKTALDRQYQADQDSTNATAQANEDKYKAQLEVVDDYYTKKLKDTNIEAEAEKLIVDNNQKEIISLLESYGQSYEISGASLGDRLVSGLKNSLSVIPDMVSNITSQINSLTTTANTANLPSIPSFNSITNTTVNNTSISNSKSTNIQSTNSQPYVIQNHLYLDGKEVSAATQPYDNKSFGTSFSLTQRGLRG